MQNGECAIQLILEELKSVEDTTYCDPHIFVIWDVFDSTMNECNFYSQNNGFQIKKKSKTGCNN